MLRHWFPLHCILALSCFPAHVAWAQVFGFASLSKPTFAGDELAKKVFEEPVATATTASKWNVGFNVGASFSLNTNSNVVGTDDGTTVLLGALVSGSATFKDKQHVWDNTLSLQETFSRSPGLDQFIKSVDQLDIQSTYTYRLITPDWLGFFGRATLNTQILVGEVVDDQPLRLARPIDNSTNPGDLTLDNVEERPELTNGATTFQLTGSFEPLNLRQTLGLYAEPYTSDQLQVGIRVGIGAQEIFFQGGDVVLDTLEANESIDGQTEIVVIRELGDTVFELGVEAELDARGELVPKKLSYYATLNTFYPALTASDDRPSFSDRLNVRLKAGVSLNLIKSVSVDYVLTVLRVPAITTELQVQNGLLVSVGFDLI
ncbi:MAG: DUF3078 domain-containing protein [Myxococcales bacterium]|nr:DUF3078 domain-containing protein [Myxococcales bacterium]